MLRRLAAVVAGLECRGVVALRGRPPSPLRFSLDEEKRRIRTQRWRRGGRHLTVSLVVALLAGLLTTLTAVPAQAETRTLFDKRDPQLAAKYDIRRVVLKTTSRRFVVRVTVRRMRTKNVMLNLKFSDVRGAPHYARIWKNAHGTGHDVLVQMYADDQVWHSYPCPGLRQRWVRSKNRIVMSLPYKCGGGPVDNTRVYTGPWDAGTMRDKVVSKAVWSYE